MSWTRHGYGYMHTSPSNDYEGFVNKATEKDNVIPLYVMTDKMEEEGHPAAKIIRAALDHGSRSKLGTDKTSTPGYYHNQVSFAPTRKIIVEHKPGQRNHVTIMSSAGYYHFTAPHSNEHTDYLHSTGMPQ